jgi:hypothetical protein
MKIHAYPRLHANMEFLYGTLTSALRDPDWFGTSVAPPVELGRDRDCDPDPGGRGVFDKGA